MLCQEEVFFLNSFWIYHCSWNPLKHSGCRAILHFLRKYSVVFPHSVHRRYFALLIQGPNLSNLNFSETLVFFLESGWLFCNVGNICQQCYIRIQEGQVAFVLGFLFGVAKFEMPCFHRDLHRNGRLASTISCFYVQSYTWLCFDPSGQLSPFLHCIFWCVDIATYRLNLSFSWCTRFVFAVGFNPYFDDITFTILLSFNLMKTILVLSSITTSANPLSSFSISFTCFNGAFSTLFNGTVSVATISFSLKKLSNWGLAKKLSVLSWSFGLSYDVWVDQHLHCWEELQ